MHHVVRTQVQREIKFTTHVHRSFEKNYMHREHTVNHFFLGFGFGFGFGFGGNGRKPSNELNGLSSPC